MTCPCLKGGSIKQCGAVQCTVVLSGCELSGFCVGGDYRSCPVFRAREKTKGDRLSLTRYYAIYSSWVRSADLAETA